GAVRRCERPARWREPLARRRERRSRRRRGARAAEGGGGGRRLRGDGATGGLDRSMRVLLIQLGRLGDVLLGTPAIRSLREACPDAEIDFLTRPAFAPILDGNPGLRRVRRYLPRRTEAELLAASFGADRYDVVVDFQSTPHSAILARLTRAPMRIGWGKRF